MGGREAFPETRGEAIDWAIRKLPEATRRGAIREILGGLYDTGGTIAGHKANEIVNDQGMSRLEAAEFERHQGQLGELERHRKAIENENERHSSNLERFDIVFRERLFIA